MSEKPATKERFCSQCGAWNQRREAADPYDRRTEALEDVERVWCAVCGWDGARATATACGRDDCPV